MNRHATLALLVTAGLAAPAWAQEIECESHSKKVLKSTIVFASTRDNPTLPGIQMINAQCDAEDDEDDEDEEDEAEEDVEPRRKGGGR